MYRAARYPIYPFIPSFIQSFTHSSKTKLKSSLNALKITHLHVLRLIYLITLTITTDSTFIFCSEKKRALSRNSRGDEWLAPLSNLFFRESPPSFTLSCLRPLSLIGLSSLWPSAGQLFEYYLIGVLDESHINVRQLCAKVCAGHNFKPPAISGNLFMVLALGV